MENIFEPRQTLNEPRQGLVPCLHWTSTPFLYIIKLLSLFIHYCAVRRALPWRTCRNLLFPLKINTAMSCCRWSWRLATISPSGWLSTCRIVCVIGWCQALIFTYPGSASMLLSPSYISFFYNCTISTRGACSSGRSFPVSLNPSSMPLPY